MTEKRIMALILALFIILGISYAVVTPVFEASDELWHYPMIRHLADGNPLPVQVFDPAQAGPWNQEASQPPLYYYLGAALTFWIDTSDMEQIRWLNPHVDNGLITADGNINLAVHDPAANPWQGTLLAVRIVRIFSVFLGAATVCLTYLIGKEAAPNRPEIALGAAAMNAFMPMFLFISGAVNNDNLAVPLASLAILLMIRMVKRAGGERGVGSGERRTAVHNSQFTIHISLFLGIVIGLALLTKEGTIGLLPLAWGTLFVASWRADSGQRQVEKETHPSFLIPHPPSPTPYPFLRQLLPGLGQSLLDFAVVLVPVILIAGWWYWRNIVLYGDWLGWSAFIAVLGQRAQPASLAQLWDERWGFMLSYWGLFGGVNVPMWTWIYHALNGMLVAGVAGFVVYFVKEINDLRLMIKENGLNLRSLIFNLLEFVTSHFALVICLLFSGAVVYGLVQWATTTWSSQGRLVFTAVSALNVLLVVGLANLFPPRRARQAITGLSLFMFLIAALAPWLWIRPAYWPETYQPNEAALQQIEVDFGGQMRLIGYDMLVSSPDARLVKPDDVVDIILEWEALTPMARDWSVFVHLNDPVLGVPIAQRDMYPGQGLRPTSLLQPGERITNYYRLKIPKTAVAPADLLVNVGLYDFYTGERLQAEGDDESAVIAALALTAVPGAIPNPTTINFGDELTLVGYELKPRRTTPGATVDLTLYWRGRRPLTTGYTIFAQIVDEDTTRWAANDLAPAEGTASWPVGELQTLTMPLNLAADTPPQVYPLIIGVYTRTEDGGFQRLQLVTEDDRITQDDFLTLTKIRVD